MKKLIQLLVIIAFITSCSSTKNYSHGQHAENDLQNVVQTLNKNPGNEKARKALPVLYAETKQFHLSNIMSFKAANKEATPHWNDIILEYQALQNVYSLIKNSVVANKLVTAINYEADIQETKETAGKHFYQLAESLLRREGRKNAQQALAYFKVCDYYFPGYEKVKSMVNLAYQRAVINVVIDSSDNPANMHFIIDSNWNISGYNLSNQFFRKKLIADLQNDFLNASPPIAFYTQHEAQKNNIKPDWLISLNLKDMTLYYRSFSILGPPEIYTVTPLRYPGSAYVKISVNIKNIDKDKTISLKILKENCKFPSDMEQGKDFIDLLQKIYAKIYPEIKDNIMDVAMN